MAIGNIDSSVCCSEICLSVTVITHERHPYGWDLRWVGCCTSLTHWGRQNGRHVPDDTFKCIFLNGNVLILIKILLKFVPKGLINNIPALDQIMAWRRPGHKPLSEPMMVSLPTHISVTRPQWVKYAHNGPKFSSGVYSFDAFFEAGSSWHHYGWYSHKFPKYSMNLEWETLNSLAPGKSEWNFRYVIFQGILVIDGWGISSETALIWMSLDFNDDQSTLVQVMAWCHQVMAWCLFGRRVIVVTCVCPSVRKMICSKGLRASPKNYYGNTTPSMASSHHWRNVWRNIAGSRPNWAQDFTRTSQKNNRTSQ